MSVIAERAPQSDNKGPRITCPDCPDREIHLLNVVQPDGAIVGPRRYLCVGCNTAWPAERIEAHYRASTTPTDQDIADCLREDQQRGQPGGGGGSRKGRRSPKPGDRDAATEARERRYLDQPPIGGPRDRETVAHHKKDGVLRARVDGDTAAFAEFAQVELGLSQSDVVRIGLAEFQRAARAGKVPCPQCQGALVGVDENCPSCGG